MSTPVSNFYNMQFSVVSVGPRTPKQSDPTQFYHIVETDKEKLVLWNINPIFHDGVDIFVTYLKINMKYGKQWVSTKDTEVKIMNPDQPPFNPSQQPSPQQGTARGGQQMSSSQVIEEFGHPPTPQQQGGVPEIIISFECPNCKVVSQYKFKN